MEKPRIFKSTFAGVYPLYIKKVERKGRTQEEVDTIICWLTGTTNKNSNNKLIRTMILKPFLIRRHS